MPSLLRKPLTYLVLGECLVVAALAVAGWHLIPRHQPRSQAVQPAAPEPAPTNNPEPLPTLPITAPRRALPKPSGGGAAGAATDPTFWTSRLATLNRDQAELQKGQWRLVDTILGAARRYLDAVVVPAVEQAARDHRPRSQSPPG